MDQKFQTIIEEKDYLIEMLSVEVMHLNNHICQMREGGPEKNQSTEQLVLLKKAYTLDNLRDVLVPIKIMKIIEKEGKPLAVLSEKWLKMTREEKWKSMYEAIDEMSQRFGFFRRVPKEKLKADTFSEAMVTLYDGLRLRKHFYLTTGTMFAQPFANCIENKLHQCLCDTIF